MLAVCQAASLVTIVVAKYFPCSQGNDTAIPLTPTGILSLPSTAVALTLLIGSISLLAWLQRRSRNVASSSNQDNLPDHVIPDNRLRAFHRASKVMSILAGSFGAMVLIGWAAGIPLLKSVSSDYPNMKVNTALCLLTTGIALWLANRISSRASRVISRILAALTAVIGGLTILEYLTGWNLHIDQALFLEPGLPLSTASPGRMAFVSALSFFLLGFALAVLSTERFTRLAQALALITGAFCLLSINSYLYGIHHFEGMAVYAASAIHTSVGVLLLSLGILFCCPGRGLMRTIALPAPGGVMAFRLLPRVLLLPSVLGWIRWQGQLQGYYDTAFGLALFTSINAVCFFFLIWTTASLLNRLERVRLRSDREVRDLNETLEARVAQRTAELQASEQSFRSIIDAVKDYSIITLDAAGNVTTWNSGAERQKGYSAEEILGKHLSTFYSSEDQQQGVAYQELAVADKTGECHQQGWRVRKDGQRFWADVLITSVRNEDGSLRGFSKITRDITEQKRAQKALNEANNLLELRVTELAQTNRELARKSEEVEAFVYIVSHDLRAPLVNLQGFSRELEMSCDELRENLLPILLTVANTHGGGSTAIRVHATLEGRIQAILQEEIPGSLHYISASTTKFRRLIDSLLELSRYGREAHRPEDLDLSAMVSNTLDLMRLSIAASGAHISVGPMPRVHGDATALGQVFSNLIGNSLKYLQPGRPGQIEIGGQMESGMAHCWVRDNGAGLPPSAKARLFQVFQRFHPQLAPGEGMGLAIVKRIVERHGGKIWAEGEEGVGTTFHFTLADE